MSDIIFKLNLVRAQRKSFQLIIPKFIPCEIFN
jgi:hypothetical protein